MKDTLINLVLGGILGGIVTLALNLVRIVLTSVSESQRPRLDLLRQALEGFNEATFVFGCIGREQGIINAREALNLPEYDKDKFNKYSELLDEGMRHLSNAVGHTLAIGHSGIARELRDFQNMVFDNIKQLRKGATKEEHSKYVGDFTKQLQTRRDAILAQFEMQLRNEALLLTAVKRYFGS